MNQSYLASELAVIIPTKDRPEKMDQMLQRLVNQTIKCGRIIIVASGCSIRNIIERYKDRLMIDYCESTVSGQIKQRNLGIQRLDARTRLVATLDDDILLEPDAIEKMIAFWNRCDKETVGVGFNIISDPPHKHSWIRRLIGISVNQPGVILPSGWSTSICNVSASIKTQWLNGGATVWRQDVLQTRRHKEINAKWAVCEDVIFSYPIGRDRPLYVCADAKVIHDHTVDQKVAGNLFQFRGRSLMLWTLYFVNANSELSKAAYCWSWLGFSLSYALKGLFSKAQRSQRLHFALGLFTGGLTGLMAVVRGKDLQSLMERGNS